MNWGSQRRGAVVTLLRLFGFLLHPWVSTRAWPWVGWGAVTGEFCTYAEDHGIVDDPCSTDRMPWDQEQRAWAGHGAAHAGRGWQTW